MAAITELAPARYVGMMIGIWFVSLGFGVKAAGLLANFAAVSEGVTQKAQILGIYGNAFAIYAGITLVVFLIMLSLVPYVNRLISLHNRQH
jgi:POT family proton-dependent oligopeptide transporter